jgi:hypothetical protein
VSSQKPMDSAHEPIWSGVTWRIEVEENDVPAVYPDAIGSDNEWPDILPRKTPRLASVRHGKAAVVQEDGRRFFWIAA